MTYRNPYDKTYNPRGTEYVAELIKQIDYAPQSQHESEGSEIQDMSALPRYSDGASMFIKTEIPLRRNGYKGRFIYK